jgi:hypothetical protein
MIVGVRLQQAIRIAGHDIRTSFPSPPRTNVYVRCTVLLQRLLSRSRALTWFLFSSRSCAPSVRCFYSFALSSPDAVRVFLALSRPLCPAFDFFRALALRRRSCFSRALAPLRRSSCGAPFAANALNPFVFLSRFCAPSTHRLSFLALSRPDAVRFLAPPLPPTCAFSCALALNPFVFLSRFCAPSTQRLPFLALSRPDAV